MANVHPPETFTVRVIQDLNFVRIVEVEGIQVVSEVRIQYRGRLYYQFNYQFNPISYSWMILAHSL